uniref:Uncharacterized protein n=1 Tax=Candidatus Kentrum sp. FW TaxID=2126338 RepID=A0A450TRL2_9GAMM|nr:MAG: hypothetical protein BECKFW1821C_GA0114237_10254 [Candidatus Kentron sp. FW]
MNKRNPQDIDELRPEYKRTDFGEMVRGKYADKLSGQTNVVILEPDVAQAFPNDKAVNDALRALLRTRCPALVS